MYNRKIKLIRALLGHERMSSAELMDKLDISQRTLRNEVKEINEILRQENVGIYSSNTGGYYLKAEEKQNVQKVLDRMIRKSKNVILPETPDERFLFGFTTLFFEKRPISIQRTAEKIYVSNYHGFCRSILKKYGHRLHPALSNLDTLQSVDDSRSDSIMRVFNNISIDEANVLSEFSAGVKNIKGKYLKENIDKYNSIVISKLLIKNAIPYNAIITLTIKLFKEQIGILEFYRNYYTSILVDEFQDTNLLSYWLLNFLITDKTNILLLGDSLQRIYGFIGAVPNLLSHAQNTFNLQLISLEKNYRFASNENMLLLDKIIRQNAITPFDNPNSLKSKVEFNIYDNQEEEALQVVIKSQKILQNDSFAKVAILAKQRGPNIEHIIKTFNHNKIPFFYGLFTDEDSEYITFNRKCLYEFIELLKSNSKINKKIGKKLIDKILLTFSSNFRGTSNSVTSVSINMDRFFNFKESLLHTLLSRHVPIVTFLFNQVTVVSQPFK